MTRHQPRIEYGDSLRIQPQLSKIVDRAVVKFVNAHNRERDDMKGFDDPLFHLPKPEEPTLKVHSVKELLVQVSDAPVLAPKMYAFRRWHGADWWMVLSENIEEVPVGCTVTRRVTVLPDSTEPDTLDFLPDLVVTRGGARFILPERKLNGQEFRQQVSLFGLYRFLMYEASDNAHLDEKIIGPLSRAWEYTSMFDPDDATVFASS